MGKKRRDLRELVRAEKRVGAPIPPHLRPRPALDYEFDAKPDRSLRSVLRTLTPGLNHLTGSFQVRWLRRDGLAGVAVAAYLIPQVMAYSAIIGVPPVASLWTAVAAIAAYAVLGSSRILSSGPESTVALMTAVAIAPLAANNPDRALALSSTLALIVAGWCLLARLLRAGIIAELLSTPLLTGYLAGSAVLMVISQLGKVTGTSYEGGSLVQEIRGYLGVAIHTDWLPLTIAASTLAIILLLAWLSPSLPGPLIAVTLATVASVVLNLESHGVAIVGEIPSGLPLPHLPAVTFDEVKMLLLAGLGVTIVGYSDVTLIARGFPLTPDEGETAADVRPDPQAELVAMAGVHTAVGLFSGYPVSASGSRTALAITGRAGSQIYSLTAGLCVVAVLFFAGPLMAPLPWAALGGVVLYAAGKLVSIPEFRRLWFFRRREFVLAVVTLVGTVVVGIMQGVVLAIALSFLEMLFRLARPHEGVLGRVPGIPGMHDVDDYPDARTIPGCIFYRYDAPLFFANIGDLRERVHKLLDLENQAYPDSPVRWFVLNVEANTEIDITAADGLRELACELANSGTRLGLARVKNDLYTPLQRAGVIDVIGKDMLFVTLPVAEESYLRWALAQEPPAQAAETPVEVIDHE
ncbi:MAG: SulP family inorganic anion transporter, partial [Pseudonocardia sp.]|nr:SulP family inorganic anion transporter [Pseudonocardia sp.]